MGSKARLRFSPRRMLLLPNSQQFQDFPFFSIVIPLLLVRLILQIQSEPDREPPAFRKCAKNILRYLHGIFS